MSNILLVDKLFCATICMVRTVSIIWQGFRMAYFLKKCTKKGKVYLSIVNSFYDPERGYTAHETYKSFGTGSGLIEQGIGDADSRLRRAGKEIKF